MGFNSGFKGLTPRKYFFTYLYYRLSPPQGHSAAGRIKPINNLNYSTWNRTRDLPACSAAPAE